MLQENLPPPSPNPPSEDHDASDLLPLTDEQFEKLLVRECRHWQRALRLQDWNVKVSVVRLNQMPDKEAIGCIFPSLERKDAHMMLLSPVDVPLLAGNFLNHEEVNYGLTIVHELLHLHLAPFTHSLSDTEQVAEEQAINAISRCLIAAPTVKHKPIVPPTVEAGVGHYL